MFRPKLFSLATLIITFVLFAVLSPSTTYAEAFTITAEDDAGGSVGSGSNSESDGTLYIVAGLAAAAIIGYMIYKRADDSEDDSTNSEMGSIHQLLDKEKNSFSNQIREVKEQIPVDVSFSIKKPSATIPEHIYSVGLSFRF